MSTLHVPVRPEILKAVEANFADAETNVVKSENLGKVELCEGFHVRDTEHLIFFEGDPVAIRCYNCNNLMIINDSKFEEWKKSGEPQ